ncbi:MAG: hypothetical protein NE334_13775 [Lentisphaeraceae bacterium]|nr:hypothetical protein [Lentisphaeraceae bacterium]
MIASDLKNNIDKIRAVHLFLDLQNKFAEIVKKTEVKKAKIQKSLERLNNNFNALSQNSLKGELKMSEAKPGPNSENCKISEELFIT